MTDLTNNIFELLTKFDPSRQMRAKRCIDFASENHQLLTKFDPNRQMRAIPRLNNYSLSEEQFAKLVGRSRMYQYLLNQLKKQLPKLLFPDGHLSTVVKDYYRDESFCRTDTGDISL